MTKSGPKKMRAYVLIETAPGKTKTVKKGLAAVEGTDSTVVNLDAVTGPFDFIAVVEGSSLDAVGRLVTDEIGSIDGVTRTTTCLAVAIG
jgi:DNA-binding Lrp family transcriptional regulator